MNKQHKFLLKMAELNNSQDNIGIGKLDEIVLAKVAETTELQHVDMVQSLLSSLNISCTAYDVKFLSTKDIRSRVEVVAKKNSYSVAHDLNCLLSLITHEEIESAKQKVNSVVEECKDKVILLTNIVEKHGYEFSLTSCPSYFPMELEKNQVVCNPPLYYSENQDDLFRIIADLICYYAKVEKICTQCLSIRESISSSPERCLLNYKNMEAEALWTSTIESAARVKIQELNIPIGSKKSLEYMEQLELYEKNNNPIFPFRSIEMAYPAQFAQNLVITKGVNQDCLTGYKMFWYLRDMLLPFAKLSSWLKEKYLCEEKNVESFLKLGISILRGPKFALSLSSSIAMIWIWMDTRIANHGDCHKLYFVEYINEHVLIGESVEPGTVINLISKLKNSVGDEIINALNFCSRSCSIEF